MFIFNASLTEAGTVREIRVLLQAEATRAQGYQEKPGFWIACPVKQTGIQ
jgi:hypothetical protein